MDILQKNILKYQKVHKDAGTITRSYDSAGYDIKSSENCIIPAQGQTLINTGIKLELPEGCYGRLSDRSSMAYKNKLHVHGGVIDKDFTGEIKVLLHNISNEDYKINKGDKIAQLILERIIIAEIEECEIFRETERGASGFGSTGI